MSYRITKLNLSEEEKRRERSKSAESVYSREQKAGDPRKGRCRFCGCKVYRTETICGECLCEEDGID